MKFVTLKQVYFNAELDFLFNLDNVNLLDVFYFSYFLKLLNNKVVFFVFWKDIYLLKKFFKFFYFFFKSRSLEVLSLNNYYLKIIRLLYKGLKIKKFDLFNFLYNNFIFFNFIIFFDNALLVNVVFRFLSIFEKYQLFNVVGVQFYDNFINIDFIFKNSDFGFLNIKMV